MFKPLTEEEKRELKRLKRRSDLFNLQLTVEQEELFQRDYEEFIQREAKILREKRERDGKSARA